MIDIHCHLLPGIDDGPATMEETLAMASAAQEDGTRVIVATPHVNWTYRQTTPELIAARLHEVREALRNAQLDVDVRLGAELDVTLAARLDDDGLRALRLGGGPWLLVECPIESYSSDHLAAAIRRLASRGHRIVLAHPERCRAFQRDPDTLRDLVREGMPTCVTAGALSGRFGTTVCRFAMTLMRNELVHVVASDAHDARRRSPRLRSELQAARLRGDTAVLASEAPAAILAGTDLPPAGPVRRARRLWR